MNKWLRNKISIEQIIAIILVSAQVIIFQQHAVSDMLQAYFTFVTIANMYMLYEITKLKSKEHIEE